MKNTREATSELFSLIDQGRTLEPENANFEDEEHLNFWLVNSKK